MKSAAEVASLAAKVGAFTNEKKQKTKKKVLDKLSEINDPIVHTLTYILDNKVRTPFDLYKSFIDDFKSEDVEDIINEDTKLLFLLYPLKPFNAVEKKDFSKKHMVDWFKGKHGVSDEERLYILGVYFMMYIHEESRGETRLVDFFLHMYDSWTWSFEFQRYHWASDTLYEMTIDDTRYWKFSNHASHNPSEMNMFHINEKRDENGKEVGYNNSGLFLQLLLLGSNKIPLQKLKEFLLDYKKSKYYLLPYLINACIVYYHKTYKRVWISAENSLTDENLMSIFDLLKDLPEQEKTFENGLESHLILCGILAGCNLLSELDFKNAEKNKEKVQIEKLKEALNKILTNSTDKLYQTLREFLLEKTSWNLDEFDIMKIINNLDCFGLMYPIFLE